MNIFIFIMEEKNNEIFLNLNVFEPFRKVLKLYILIFFQKYL